MCTLGPAVVSEHRYVGPCAVPARPPRRRLWCRRAVNACPCPPTVGLRWQRRKSVEKGGTLNGTGIGRQRRAVFSWSWQKVFMAPAMKRRWSWLYVAAVGRGLHTAAGRCYTERAGHLDGMHTHGDAA